MKGLNPNDKIEDLYIESPPFNGNVYTPEFQKKMSILPHSARPHDRTICWVGSELGDRIDISGRHRPINTHGAMMMSTMVFLAPVVWAGLTRASAQQPPSILFMVADDVRAPYASLLCPSAHHEASLHIAPVGITPWPDCAPNVAVGVARLGLP
eukprot:COSAG01_NODE_322_length_18892_cov_92.312191_1_plen_154_part_00